jgi:S-sulfosulfanyl-L-cysteine sulfohydrolase
LPVKELTIVQVNDTHAYFHVHPELFWRGNQVELRPAGGYARLAGLINTIRAERPGKTLVFDGGDTFHGTYAAVQSRGEALVPVLRALGFDAMTAHWDFAYGPQQLKQLEGQLGYPVLALNVSEEHTGQRFFDPYRIMESGGLRVGVLGIAAWIVGQTMPAHFSQGLRFSLGNEELPGLVRHLRSEEKVDLVILLSHLGFPQDVKLAEETPGIDVLLSSHTHNRLYAPARVGSTLIIQSGSHGSFLGRLDVQVHDGKVIDFRHWLYEVGPKIDPDPAVQSLVEQADGPYRELLGEPVGRTRTILARDRVLETTMDNLLLQGLLDHTGAELAFSNGWRYGAPIPAGVLTREHLYNIIPVNPPVSVTELAGDELWAMMEENLEHTFACDPYQQMGGYVKRVLGLHVYAKVENPPGQRLQQLFAGREPVQPGRTYQAAFVTSQAVPPRFGSQRREMDVSAVTALEQYLKRVGEADASLQGSVVLV